MSISNDEFLKQKQFFETELGSLFVKYQSAVSRAWQEDERSSWTGKHITSRKLWEEHDILEKQFIQKLMSLSEN